MLLMFSSRANIAFSFSVIFGVGPELFPILYILVALLVILTSVKATLPVHSRCLKIRSMSCSLVFELLIQPLRALSDIISICFLAAQVRTTSDYLFKKSILTISESSFTFSFTYSRDWSWVELNIKPNSDLTKRPATEGYSYY